MTVAMVDDDVIASKLPDVDHLPMTADVAVDEIEYAEIMRGILGDDTTAPPISAFNSSI